MQLPEGLPRYYMQFAANQNTIFAKYQEIVGYPKSENRDVIRAWWKENQYKEKEQRIHLFEVNNEGMFTEKTSFTWTQPAQQPNIVMGSTREAIFCTVNSLSSPVPIWITQRWIITDSYRNGPVWSRETLKLIKAYSFFKTPINLCVMAVFSVVALWHGWPRRTHIAKLILWTVFVFLFNLPGFLTYLALNHFPVIRCANCGKKRGLRQDTCCRCGVALPLPESKETDLVMALSI